MNNKNKLYKDYIKLIKDSYYKLVKARQIGNCLDVEEIGQGELVDISDAIDALERIV